MVFPRTFFTCGREKLITAHEAYAGPPAQTSMLPIAKITRPHASNILRRERLFRVLDEARSLTATWITSPAGSGKTMLVASYLDDRALPCLWYRADSGDTDTATFFYYLGLAARSAAPRFRSPLPLFSPEYTAGIAVFARRYFEHLCQRLPSPFVLVFDDLDAVPAGSSFPEVLREAVSVLPEGIHAMLLSRGSPPPAFARLTANGGMSLVGWDDVKFDRAECEALIAMRIAERLPDAVLRQLCEKLDGWVAGLVLTVHSVQHHGVDPRSLASVPVDAVFDYFSREVLDRTDTGTRDFLLRTSFLSELTSRLAARLTGNDRAPQVLAELSSRHYFTDKHSSADGALVYRYHPLFREFLQARAADAYGHEELQGLRRTAAGLLAKSGKIEDAVELLHRSEGMPELVRLILNHAPALLAQGRHRSLATWISWLPGEMVRNDPWLLVWSSLCHMPFEPRRSLPLAERAYELHRERKDVAGMFMSCYPAIGAICYEQTDLRPLDRWIEALEGLFRRAGHRISPEIAVLAMNALYMALVLRQPFHRNIGRYRDRLLQLTRAVPDANVRILFEVDAVLYPLWTGDLPRAIEVIETLLGLAGRQSASLLPLPQVNLRTFEAMFHAFTGAPEACAAAAEAGLSVARASGVPAMEAQLMAYAAAGAICAGNLDAAACILHETEPRLPCSPRAVIALCHFVTAWHRLLRDDAEAALHHAGSALDLAVPMGFRFLEGLARYGMAQVQYRRGEARDARLHLAKASRTGRAMKSGLLEYMCLLSAAHAALDAKRTGEARTLLRRSLALGRKREYSFFLFWQPQVMARLCAAALDAGIEVPYVRDLIRKRGLTPDEPRACSDAWPWPVKVRTLGTFEVLRDGVPLRFSGKVPHKPLALLKALIAHGGEMGIDQAAFALWPDVEGDRAHKACEIAILRLRKVLGLDKAVRLHEGRLTLDPRYCRVDSWALEQCIARADDAWSALDRPAGGGARSRTAEANALQLTENVLHLYPGHFLPADSGQPWIVPCRERLRSRIIRAIMRLGTHLELTGQWSRAAECYQKGIETDGLVEQFYHRLMVCHHQLRQRAEVMRDYEHCRAALASDLGIAPSPATDDLYRDLMKDPELIRSGND